MGLFDVFGSSARLDGSEPEGATAASVTEFVERLLKVGFEGSGRFASAQATADAAMARRSSPERAIDDLVAAHVRLAAANGFVTGLGGFATLVVALPANVAGFYVVATRMAASIVAVRGYDLTDPSVRSAVLLSLVGSDADVILQRAGAFGAGSLSNVAARQLPRSIGMAINKGVGFRLLTGLSRKGLARMGRAVPFVGGAVGAGVDSFLLSSIAAQVRREFPRRLDVPGQA